MRTLASLALVFAICLSAAPADASEWGLDKWAKRESGWKGHGVGSSYTTTTTIPMPNMPNMPDMPGMPKGGKMTTTAKYTLTAINKDSYTIKVETTTMGRTMTNTQTEPKVRTLNMKDQVVDAGEGTVKVEGKTYTCKVKTVKSMEAFFGDSMPKGPPGRGGSMKPTFSKGKVWVHPTLGVLKMETTANIMGQNATMSWQVNRLSVSHTIGKHTFNCREMKMTTGTQMGNSTVTMIMAPSFPGGTLKSVMNSKMMGRDMKITTTYSNYVKKPVAAVTGATK
ncbi:MAG: hypothetical protein QNJ90_07220 [Planctomycetota bacterium]|nr:hypothetical protein [Planctomycetota bacterium]